MILRKPYAFLIKHFKIIHIILFLIFGYLVFTIRNIYMFFVNYVKNGGFTYLENMADRYMNPLVFIMIILIIAFAISVFELMKKKEKPILFYRILIVYGFVLLIFWIYFRHFFSTLDEISYESLTIVIYRDITAFLYYINFFYVGFSFIRGFGFDIKKFSFDKDKKELNLEETDNEEYELNLGVDKDNVTNYLRKERREFKYYIKENKGFLILGLIILIIVGGIYTYFNYFVPNKIYNEHDQFNINGIIYRINNSMLTKENKYSEVILQNNIFLVVNMDILNNNKDKEIEKENFRVKVDNNYYYPVSNYNDSFNDIGTIYKDKMVIKNNIVTNINLIYKLEDTKMNEIYFELLNNKNSNNNFEKILLAPKNSDRVIKTYNMTDSVNILNNVVKVLEFKLYDKTSYEYENCYNSVCNKLTKMVIPKLNDYILSLEIDNLKNIDKEFLENYLGIKYKYSNKEYNVSSKTVEIIDINNNILYLNVPKNVSNANSITLIVKTRWEEYNIKLENKNE